ncbi:hypothetical protein EON64_10665 [archaeon]|nr:MAG: hypothetical protein EON64_10665 [archaeon]
MLTKVFPAIYWEGDYCIDTAWQWGMNQLICTAVLSCALRTVTLPPLFEILVWLTFRANYRPYLRRIIALSALEMEVNYIWSDQIPEKDGEKLAVNDVAFSPGDCCRSH